MVTPRALGRGMVVLPGAVTTHDVVVTIDEAALAHPTNVVETMHQHWLSRTPLSVVLAVDPSRLRSPRSEATEPHRLEPDFTPWWDRLHFLLWANNLDCRTGTPIWWWSRKAVRLGAKPGGGRGDILLMDGTAAYVDGGPRDPTLAARHPLVHAETVDLGRLELMRPAPAVTSELAPDQRAAVTHGSGPARILAPAGSGKTRVLAERLKHLVSGCGYEPAAMLALAYNRRAQAQLEARTQGLGVRIQTLNSLGLEILREVRSGVSVVSERDLRALLESVLPELSWRSNTDPLSPYIEALASIRLGLRSPDAVEADRENVTGLAEAFPRFRAALRQRNTVDFDEQLYAAVEALLSDGELRRRWQRRCRHLLVDEFQDLRPLHLLLIRLLACPELDVFGVGDDDQVIYGYDGASPRFLTDFDHFFPGAADHPLVVNYRSPVAVIDATSNLLSYNSARVAKRVRPGPAAVTGAAALVVQRQAGEEAATAIHDTVMRWLNDGVAATDIAILSRVNSSLLVPQVVLMQAAVPVVTAVDVEMLGRTGTRAALAYLRIATAGTKIAAADIAEILRRPSRGLPPWFGERIHRRRSWSLPALAEQPMPEKEVPKLERLVRDLTLLQRLAAGADTAQVLAAVRLEVGLGGAMAMLSRGTGADRSSHLDDLQSLERIAPLARDPAAFEPWLRELLARPGESSGVTLSTVHRVKGLEWPRVCVIDVAEGMMPHRLSEDLEEERRIFHVALTRGRTEVVIHADSERPSRFEQELVTSIERRPRGAPVAAVTISPVVGDRLTVSGGIEGEVTRVTVTGVTLSLGPGTNLLVRVGERVSREGVSGPLAAPDRRGALASARSSSHDGPVSTAERALRQWRLERARHDGVPPYVVLHDATLIAIAELKPTSEARLATVAGIGPAKLERYGADILAVLASR